MTLTMTISRGLRAGRLASLFAVCMATNGLADNWAHWRGPLGNGVAPKATPPTVWSATENVKWKVAIPGVGSSSPIVWQDRVFVTSAVPTSNRTQGLPELDFNVYCFRRDSGELVWERTAITAVPHEATHQTNGFASASPCTDGLRVYAHFGSRGLFCYSLEGELVWQRDLGDMRTRSEFGEGSSPTLESKFLLVPWDHEGASALYALDKTTGDVIWKAERDEPTGWATPLVVSDASGHQQVVMNGQNYARAYDLDTGKELWRCGGQTDRPAASAVSDGKFVFVGSGFRGAFMGAFRPEGRGDIAGSENVVWTIGRDTPDIASPLLINGRLYFHKGKSGLLSCVDAGTGKVLFGTSRIPELDSIYASPVAAGGHVYLSDRDGTTVVIKEGPALEIVATNSLGETIDATPAPVDNQLFIRGAKHLFCIE